MIWKAAIASTIASAFLGVQAAVATNYQSNVDPTKITLPSIPQSTSLDPATECQYYSAPEYTIDATQWPKVWEIATSNGMNTSQEFQALYASIDWNSAPKIQPRAVDANGAVVTTGYDVTNDPDCWWTATQCMTPKASGVNGDIFQCPEPRTLGLTYDDGPNCSHNAFYDFLLEKNQSASMFYIGSNVLGWPYGALRGVKDGHHIAGHTWSHRLMTTLTNEEVLAELYYTQKAIKFITGVTPLYWRPAQGDIDDRVRWIATQLNLTAILWNIDTDDWRAGISPGVTAETVGQNYEKFASMGKDGTFANSGSIILSHEINNMTMGFAMTYYPLLKDSYEHVVNVATCMNITHPYVETSISFPSFAAATGTNPPESNSQGSNKESNQNGGTGAASTLHVNIALFIAALFSVVLFI